MADQDPAPGSRSDGSSTADVAEEPAAGADHAYGSETGIPPASGGPGYPSPSIAPYEPEPLPARGVDSVTDGSYGGSYAAG